MKKYIILALLPLACNVETKIDNYAIARCVKSCNGVEYVDYIHRVGSFPWSCVCTDGRWVSLELNK